MSGQLTSSRRRIVARAALAIAACLAVAACAGRSGAALTPIGGDAALVPGAHRVDMLIATMRKPDTVSPAQMFTGERAKDVGYAQIAISIPPDAAREIGEVQWPSRSPGDPTREFVTLTAGGLKRDEMRAQLRERAAKRNGRVLLFVHGYNNRFDDAVLRFAQVAYDSGAPAAPLLFTWPSRGKLLAYGYDHESASYSRDALEAVLDMLASEPAVREVSIIAHSMGNWVTMEALRQSAIRRGRVSPKISDVMLAAPDVDADVFGRQLAELGPQRPRLTMFVSREDRALGFSRRVWGNAPRIGAIDPEIEPYRTLFAENKLKVVDLTKVRTEDPLGHNTFATDAAVVKSIGRRIAQGQKIDESRVGVGDGIQVLATDAVGAVGGVVGGVVSAPAKLLEGRPPVDLD